jgi:hypothetical protein
MRVTVSLSEPEATTLMKLAAKELRHPREQARLIITQALREEGEKDRSNNAEVKEREEHQ